MRTVQTQFLSKTAGALKQFFYRIADYTYVRKSVSFNCRYGALKESAGGREVAEARLMV